VTPAQSRRLKEYQILVSLDMVVERTQAQYAAVSREYFAAKKSLAA
jgi:hypothetical protein